MALEDKTALITGASSGFGEATAMVLSNHVKIVVLTARRIGKLKDTCKTIGSHGGKAFPISADLSKTRDICKLGKEIRKSIGGIDILINCGAHYEGGPAVYETILSDWTYIINTNLRAPYLLAREFVPHMLEHAYGRIVNITSTTNHVAGVGAFRISKIGLEVLTDALAHELKGTGVTASAFNPNWMKTSHSRSGRSPKGAANALVKVLHRRPKALNGTFLDLVWCNRKFYLRQRKRKPGQYGFDKISAEDAEPVFEPRIAYEGIVYE